MPDQPDSPAQPPAHLAVHLAAHLVDPPAHEPPTGAAASTGEVAADAAGPEGGDGGEAGPSHWLYRLSADAWLAAATNELASAQAAFRAKQQRAAVTYSRRAGGMALNAVLRLNPEPDPRYGRSYMDHLGALAADEAQEAPLREAAARLVHMPTRMELVPLGPGDTGQAEPAARILEYARARVAAARLGGDRIDGPR